MRLSLPLFGLLWAVSLSGCFKQRICNVHYLNFGDIKKDPSMNSGLHMRTAYEVFPYAFMALYAYDNWDKRRMVKHQRERKFLYQLPLRLVIVRRIALPSGFQAVIFHRVDDKKKVQEVIVAFRGTDEASDWVYGNLGEKQYGQALTLVRQVVAKWPGIPVAVTGHSLGGGLALYVSYYFHNLRTFAFMPSFKMPRHFRKPPVANNYRLIVNEMGDILQLQRSQATPLLGITRTVIYDFTKCDTPIANHSMLNLLHGI
ncbi:DUF2974 domain-containing protein, partial [Myxococcota bacterium]|nr:DUF2974 domain-containing protein [Myxococcota bacterium]